MTREVGWMYRGISGRSVIEQFRRKLARLAILSDEEPEFDGYCDGTRRVAIVFNQGEEKLGIFFDEQYSLQIESTIKVASDTAYD